MGSIVAAMASSHAFTFRAPEEWDAFRARIDAGYARRYGRPPERNPGLDRADAAADALRYGRIRDGIASLRRTLAESRADTLILIGDDQNENFSPQALLPQLAIYLGGDFTARAREGYERRVRADPVSAEQILNATVADGFDMSMCRGFTDDALVSHAHVEIVQHVVAGSDIAVVPIFVNALHIPGPAPARCYALGRSLRRALESGADAKRYAIYASGGLSHFTGGFPWRHYSGPFGYGDISSDFDRTFIDWIERGEGAKTCNWTAEDLLTHGNVEMRSWIVLLGALGAQPTREAVYEPFHRGMMGMATAVWDPLR